MISLNPKIIIAQAGLGSKCIQEVYDIPKYLLAISVKSKKDRINNQIFYKIFKNLSHEIELINILNIKNYLQVNDFILNLLFK